MSLKIKLDLKKYELSSIKTTSTKDVSGKVTIVSELDTTKKDIELSCEEEKSLPAPYLKVRYPLITRVFSIFGPRIVNSCNFGILPLGTTALVTHGSGDYINKATIDPWGVVRVEEQSAKQNYLFLSTTAYIRFNSYGGSGMKIFTGPTAGIGYGKDGKVNSESPALLIGWSLGGTLDDTKFFAITYGFVFDPNTHVLPDYLGKNRPVPFSGVNTSGSLDALTQNKTIVIPLKTVMGRYEGIGFSFSYKF